MKTWKKTRREKRRRYPKTGARRQNSKPKKKKITGDVQVCQMVEPVVSVEKPEVQEVKKTQEQAALVKLFRKLFWG